MKIIFTVCVAVVIGFIPQSVFASSELPWEKKFPFKNVTIEYTVSGVETGTETLYIRNKGKERVKYRDTVTKMMGMAVKDTSIEFVTPDVIYTYNLQTGEAIKATNPQKIMIEEFNKLSSADKKKVRKNAEKMGTAFTQGVGGAVQEKAVEILGYDCDKVEAMGGASYILHGTDISLKTEVNMMGMKLITEATSISKGKVDKKLFKHPVGVVAKTDPQSENMARMMGQQAIAALKDPESAKQVLSPAARMQATEQDMTEEDKAMMERAGEMMKNLQNMFGQ